MIPIEIYVQNIQKHRKYTYILVALIAEGRGLKMNDIIINYFQYLDNPLTIVSIINVSIYIVITYIIRGK